MYIDTGAIFRAAMLAPLRFARVDYSGEDCGYAHTLSRPFKRRESNLAGCRSVFTPSRVVGNAAPYRRYRPRATAASAEFIFPEASSETAVVYF